MKESPIFARLHDLLLWLLRATRKLPREYRFTLGEQISRQGFALQDALIAAGLERKRQADHLLQADIALTSLRKTLLLCHELQLLDAGQYRHVSEMIQEVGRLLGGWRKTTGAP
jgi:four helix bundle protein